jgi:CheY-like chemotaxis protein
MLPSLYQRLIEMAYDQELSHSEIAIRLGQPLGTVKSRIRRALAMLRTYAREPEMSRDASPSWLEPASEALTTVDADARGAAAFVVPLPCVSVLIVDDDHETVRLVSAALRKFGLRPRTCTSAQEGLAALEESWPDVLISDLNMPGEDGYSLITKARALARDKGRDIRAAAFTSWATEDERSRALIAGFEMFINKPVHPLALVAAVARLSR